MRYHNSNFIATLDTNGVILLNRNTIIGEAFKSTTSSLLSNLSNIAYIPANNGFTAGSANYSASGTLYGLVQCWRDISIQDCGTCLVTARRDLNNCCSSNQGGQAQWGSCKVRYETFPFLDSAQSPSPSPGGSTPNTSIPATPPANGTAPATSKRHGFSSESGLLMQEQQFIFSLEMLVEATKNFHNKNKLGEGGFGAVYKGTTKDGNEIAVKKLSA
ncbi:hypothetical protein SUGI_0357190 [Cryptomeria japonica]|nr:hypothetical protein SUGI_0357190 [Cryptomeria japonica]